MKKSLFAITVALASVLVSSQIRAQTILPRELVIGKADDIVVGEVTAIGKPVEMELENSDFPAPHKGWYHTFTVKVTRRLLPVPPAANADKTTSQASGEKSPKDEVIETITMCADPSGAQSVQTAYHSALVGNSYLMLLNKLPGRGEYYLPSYPMNFRPDTDRYVKEVQRLVAAGIDSWAWGKPVDGLQVGVYLFAHYNYGGGNQSSVAASVVLRNTTDKPLAVNLYDVDKYLEITATSADGKVVHSDFYSVTNLTATKYDTAVNTIVIAPKAKIFIGSAGRADRINWSIPVGPGQYDFQAFYTSKHGGNGKDNLKLWTGTINSKSCTGTITSEPRQIHWAPRANK
jgi:hypothetical protein